MIWEHKRIFEPDEERLILKLYSKEKTSQEKEYFIQTGLYAGVLFHKGCKINITTKYGDTFLKRMLNFVNDIYVDNEQTKAKKDETENQFLFIIAHLFIQSLEKAVVLGLPQEYQKHQERSHKVRGSINFNDYLKRDIPFQGKLTTTFREQKYVQEIIDVLYLALRKLEFAFGKEIHSRLLGLSQLLKQHHSGRFASYETIQKAKTHQTINNPKERVCVLGGGAKNKLFGGADAIGQSVRIGRHAYRVVGVLELKESGARCGNAEEDDLVIVPLSTFRSHISSSPPGSAGVLFLSAASASVSDRAVAQTQEILRERHHIQAGQDDDFAVRSQAEFLKMTESIFAILTVLLMSVAAVSLVVGGIGVMNIMLVSVTERVREIGIRMATGARMIHILLQFMRMRRFAPTNSRPAKPNNAKETARRWLFETSAYASRS